MSTNRQMDTRQTLLRGVRKSAILQQRTHDVSLLEGICSLILCSFEPFTTAEEVMFLLALVCFSVCLFVC